jgi:predicted transcriptional regulator
MKGLGGMMGGGKSLPPAPPEEIRSNSLGRMDGRSARATGRRNQFNPRVREEFRTAFEEEVKAERERTGEHVTHGRLLELMLAVWRSERLAGKPAPSVGIVLPDKMLKAADALAGHLRCSREAAISAAIADQMVKLGLATVKARS